MPAVLASAGKRLVQSFWGHRDDLDSVVGEAKSGTNPGDCALVPFLRGLAAEPEFPGELAELSVEQADAEDERAVGLDDLRLPEHRGDRLGCGLQLVVVEGPLRHAGEVGQGEPGLVRVWVDGAHLLDERLDRRRELLLGDASTQVTATGPPQRRHRVALEVRGDAAAATGRRVPLHRLGEGPDDLAPDVVEVLPAAQARPVDPIERREQGGQQEGEGAALALLQEGEQHRVLAVPVGRGIAQQREQAVDSDDSAQLEAALLEEGEVLVLLAALCARLERTTGLVPEGHGGLRQPGPARPFGRGVRATGATRSSLGLSV